MMRGFATSRFAVTGCARAARLVEGVTEEMARYLELARRRAGHIGAAMAGGGTFLRLVTDFVTSSERTSNE